MDKRDEFNAETIAAAMVLTILSMVKIKKREV